jgi:UDP-N-acetylglucosamine 2-epimerase (non-hydrolysing)
MTALLHVVGARPNFMKAAPVMDAIQRLLGAPQLLVHTGQHYDAAMSQVFFDQLGLPRPDTDLGVGSSSHAVQTAQIMERMDALLEKNPPRLVLVYGDVNSTIAAALVCAKRGIPVAHVEAGLRSFDRSMPEEINRVLTDQLSDLLFTPSQDGDDNLLREGVSKDRIHLVGNVMIDTLVRLLPAAEERWRDRPRSLGLPAGAWQEGKYALVTLHRAGNVDDPARLRALLGALVDLSQRLPVIFPVHPRTRKQMEAHGLVPAGLHLTGPLGYLEFLALQKHATVVVTDSGGIQEETTYLGVPCLTLRPNTERPVTVSIGTNLVIGEDFPRLLSEVDNILAGRARKGGIPPLWDGRAAERIAEVLRRVA